MSNTKKIETHILLEQTHRAVLSSMHDALQKEAQRYSTVLLHQPYADYFYKNMPIMSLEKDQYLDNMMYSSRLVLETEKNRPYIGIFLTTEAHFPPLYARDHAWNLHDQYYFKWDSVQDIMDNMTYSTTWTITYESPSFYFCCEEMEQPYYFLKEHEDTDIKILEKARKAIEHMLNPPSFS
jgi:hypothetical protein